MNERDREILREVRAWRPNLNRPKEPETELCIHWIGCLLAIIDRLEDERIKQHDTIMNYRDEVGFLKKQLTEIKEAGDEFLAGYGYTTKTRRLSEKLKEVKDVDKN